MFSNNFGQTLGRKLGQALLHQTPSFLGMTMLRIVKSVSGNPAASSGIYVSSLRRNMEVMYLPK